MYHDDPYLLPIKKLDYRRFALSYESGRKAAMWIHREHGDLFPKHLSNPEIKVNFIYYSNNFIYHNMLLYFYIYFIIFIFFIIYFLNINNF